MDSVKEKLCVEEEESTFTETEVIDAICISWNG